MLYLNTLTGFGVGGSVALEPETTALVARMTTPPSEARKTVINDLIVALKAAGVWTSLAAIYVTAAADRQAAQLNWKGATYDLPSSGGTFTADRGIVGGLDTGYTIASLNAFYMGAWVQQAVAQSTNGIMGSATATDFSTILPRYTDDIFYAYMNQTGAGAATQANASGVAGWYVANRSGSAAAQGYLNATASSTTQASTVAPTVSVYVGQCNGFGTAHPGRYAAAMLAPVSFNSTQNGAIRSALATYMSAVGA